MATLTELNCVCGWREQGMGEVGGGGGGGGVKYVFHFTTV